jgi:hypothetical protein
MNIINDAVQKLYFSRENYKEMLNGAYIIINDHGEFYRKWNNGKTHFSSHFSNHPQFEKKLNPGMRCSAVILVGTTQNNHTWFQIEKTTRDCVFRHSLNYVDYIFSGKNIGVNGKSKYTENNPLRINKL